MMDNATKMKQESTFKFKVFAGLCCLIIFTQIWYGINYPPQCQYEKVIVEKYGQGRLSTRVDPFIKPIRENLIMLEEDSAVQSEKVTFPDQKPTTIPARKKRKIIVITTFMRSGSTFLGELFNLHPDTFYQFEPLHPYYRNGCAKMLDPKYQSMLRRLRCKFHDEYNTTAGWENIVDELDPHDKISRKGNFLFRYKSRRLCRPPFCPEDKSTEEYECKFHCPDIDPTAAREECLTKVPVIKTIRFCSMSALHKLLDEPDLDPYIIILARDPRGIFNSRDKIFTSDLYKEQDRSRNYDRLLTDAKTVCGQTERMIDYTRNHTVIDKTLVVRYEDLAMAPIVESQRIYDFVGLPFPSNVKQWINKKLSIDSEDNEDGRTFNTKKNPKDVALRWREEINASFVGEIQESCKKNMALLGYKPTDADADLSQADVITDSIP